MMSVSSPMILTPETARILTDRVKADAVALWEKLLELYECGAHTALGYRSWAQYCSVEFDMGKSQAYRLLDSGRVIAVLDESPIGERPTSEAVARELVPVLRGDADHLDEVWGQVVDYTVRSRPRPRCGSTFIGATDGGR